MPTFGPVGIAAGADDYTHTPITFSAGISFALFGADAPITYHAGFRWDNVTIPQGAQILTAVIDFRTTSDGLGTGSTLTKIAAVGEDDAAAATNDASCTTDDGIRTTAEVDWDFATIVADDEALQTDDFALVVQEIVDRTNWKSGNALLIHIFDDGSAENLQAVASANHSTFTEPQITVTYADPSYGWGVIPFGGV
jgi:hypothetical protein